MLPAPEGCNLLLSAPPTLFAVRGAVFSSAWWAGLGRRSRGGGLPERDSLLPRAVDYLAQADADIKFAVLPMHSVSPTPLARETLRVDCGCTERVCVESGRW